MMKFSLPIVLCLFAFAPLQSTHGQSLVQDTEQLLSALEMLDTASSVGNDFATVNATAQILAILQNYDQSVLTDSMNTNTWSNLLGNYQKNALVQKVLREKNFSLPDTLPTNFYQSYEQWRVVERSGERQKILSLLHAEKKVSPSSYLSVSNTLEKYALPPVHHTTTAHMAAQESNGNFNSGILNATAVIEGLFEFVLDRAKDEVVINFLEKMLNDDTPGLEKIFPTVVGQFSNKSFTYSNSFIERLREAFYQDIQHLSINLPVLLLEDDYFRSLQSEPVAYNFLAIYSMIGMSMNDLPVEEIMPITHRFIYQSYEEAMKEVSFELADKAYGQEEYSDLVAKTRTTLKQLKKVYLELDEAEVKQKQRISDLKAKFPSDIIPPVANDYLQKSAYDLDVLLGGDNGPAYDLGLLPSLLEGRLDSTYILGFTTLKSYDKFFGTEKDDRQWRAAGLEITRNLNGTWYQDNSIADIFYNWQKDLADFVVSLDKWENAIDPDGALQAAIQKLNKDRDRLVATIDATKTHWSAGIKYDQVLALDLLAKIAKGLDDLDDDPDFEDLPEGERLELKKEKLLAIEKRLIIQDKRLKTAHPENFEATPMDKLLADRNNSTTPYGYVIAQVDDLSKSLGQLDQQLKILDKKYASQSSRARDNAKPILQTTEFATQLMYGLYTGEEDHKWITKVELDSMLDGGLRQDVFMGLLTQRLSKVKDVPWFSTDGVTRLVELTVNDLPTLPKYQFPDSIKKDSMAFFHRASFVVNTLNRMLELPLVVSKENIREFTPLKNQIPGMANVPDIANNTLDFVYYLNIKDHRHAISTLMRLFDFLDEDVDRKAKNLSANSKLDLSDKQPNKRKKVIHYFQKYGSFVADLIDAEEGDEVKDLLTNIADPPGSSRLKRTQEMTVGFNAYLGGNVGWETWSGSSITTQDEGYFGLAPSIPIGISVSRLFGKKKHSFSLFVSFLDLGSLLTFRPDSDTFGEPVLTFRNVFKPGLQMQYNIPKTPFYLATGSQYGPQVLEVANKNISLNSTRFFFGFGVDVPIKTLFQK